MTVYSQNEVTQSLKEASQCNGTVDIVASITISDAKIQKDISEESDKESLKDGDKWYLIDIRWYNQWKRYIESTIRGEDGDSQHPGPIDNSPLLQPDDPNLLKEHLLEGVHYRLVNESVWNCLQSSYGLATGQEPIKRCVISDQFSKVEVYRIELQLCTFKEIERVVTKSYSRIKTLEDIVRDMKLIFSIPQDEEVRVWSRFNKQTYELLPRMASTLQDNSIGTGQMLVLERKENDEWVRQTRTRSMSSSSGINLASSPIDSSEPLGMSSPFASVYRPKSIAKPGLCGLNNLGNTCFMNAALQCLSNTTPLTKYFMSNTHKHELNPTNPLGMHGKIAEAYGELVQQMWSGGNSSVIPRHFKMQVGRFAPQFSGYQQQDTHELLAFLLDGLHEDLNRVKQKPYIELQDDKGRPDETVAVESWKNHILRNDSVIVDLFHGQFKSTVECPVCNKKSITFDPFCYLSLPLPMKKERNLYITYVPLDASKKAVKLKVTIPKSGYTSDLTNAVAKMTGCEPKKLVVFDVFSSRFHKKYQEKEVLSHISDRDEIYVYEIPINIDKIREEEILVLPVYLREIRPSGYHSYHSKTLFGTPLLVTFPKASITAIEMYQIILKSMRRYVTPPAANNSPQENGKIHANDEEMQEDSSDSEEQLADDLNDESDEEMKIKHDQAEKEDSATDEKITKSKSKEPKFLFDICVVNATGSHEMKKLEYDEEPIQLKSSLYLAVDWYPKIKERYYNSHVAEDIDEHESVSAPLPPKKTTQLSDCVELFLQKEKLGEEDPWYCPVCKEHRQAYKKFDIWRLPKILIIHLKRFSYSRYYRDKLDVLVNFPVNSLDLSDYVINKNHTRAVYDLHGVANHYGGLGGGHYTAYGVNCFDAQWYYFDDSSVSSADSRSPISKAAYVLFYTRRDDPDNEMMNTSELLTEDQDVFQSSGDESMD